MKVLEVYRRLPRTNCGQCAQGACMPFAVALASGAAAPEQCPPLPAAARAGLAAARGGADWREGLIAGLRREVAALDLAGLAPALGAVADGAGLRVRCLGVEYRISPDGAVGPGEVSPWTRILLLHYVRSRGGPPPAGPWASFADLRGGMVKAGSFARDCEEPLRELLERDLPGTERALELLGGGREPNQPAPVAWRVPALPRIPALVLFWPGEEEFPAKARVLFDAGAVRFLDVESLLFLGEGLVRAAAQGPGAAPHD